MKPKTTNIKGFTLLEILFSLVILATIGIVVLNSYAQSIRVASTVSYSTKSISVAQNRIEAIKKYEALGLTDTVWQTNLNSLPTSQLVDGTRFNITTTLLTNADIASLPTTLRAIKITVSWTENKQNKSYSLISYYRK